MKLRHTAALVLTGWYLIVPFASKGKIFDDRPLSQWKKLQSLNTKSECEALSADLYNPRIDEKMRSDPKVGPEGYKLFRQYMRDMQCISNKDPCLKGN
jgi:hypothetical protein